MASESCSISSAHHIKIPLLHVSVGFLILQADDFRITHRHQLDKAVNISGLESLAFCCQFSHFYFYHVTDGQALGTALQFFILTVVFDCK